MAANIYIPYYDKGDDSIAAPLETLIVVFVSQWVRPNGVLDVMATATKSKDTSLRFVLIKSESDGYLQFQIPFNALEGFDVTYDILKEIHTSVQQCVLPCILACDGQLCVAGLGSILRHLLKKTPLAKCCQLLGFRKGCLVACAEFSVWTRFCEVDLLKSTKQHLKESASFEAHLNEPMRTHNIGKKQHQMAKEMLRTSRAARLPKCSSGGDIEAVADGKKTAETKSTQAESSNRNSKGTCEYEMKVKANALPELPHTYAEEMSMTLSDLIIFVCVSHILYRTPTSLSCLESILPSVMRWYLRLRDDPDVRLASKSCGLPDLLIDSAFNGELTSVITVPPVLQHSLHIRDPKRYNSRARIYTRQAEVTAVLDILKEAQIVPRYNGMPDFPIHEAWHWLDVPDIVLPTFGNLPECRFVRKCQQLENMAMVVCSIVQDGDTVVDFCSGGGHLGILLAYLLPKCQIIMIENKEESINRALIRARQLLNTRIYQCNLDYFHGKFDVGVALHACGVATDLVIRCCLKTCASFVVCPCCYGGVRNTHLISYPRSKVFRNAGLTPEEYYFLGHAADQTHENGHKCEQGKYCMGLVDTDRALLVEAKGYTVKIFTMQPASCSPKNNVILGVKSERHEKLQLDWL